MPENLGHIYDVPQFANQNNDRVTSPSEMEENIAYGLLGSHFAKHDDQNYEGSTSQTEMEENISYGLLGSHVVSRPWRIMLA